MTTPVLSINDLSIALSRDGRPASVLDGVGFDIAPGEILAVVGESGSGKSTIGLALQGLLPRDSAPKVHGSIRIDGIEIVGAEQTMLRRVRHTLVRAIPQDPMGGLDPTMIIRRQMAESSGTDTDVIDWLTRTGLSDPDRIAESLPHRLSGGQRQRVMIAMAMMARPKLLIADEPTTALDVTTQAQVLILLQELARESRAAVLFITHDLGVAASFADRVLVLYAGRVVEMGRVGAVMKRPSHPYSAGLVAARFDFDSDRSRPLPTLLRERGRRLDERSSCVYAPRCPLERTECITVRPVLRQSPAHSGMVACHYAEETDSLAEQTATERWPVAAIGNKVVLELTGVRKGFHSRMARRRERPNAALRSIDLEINEAECVALVGESGAGKTTLLRIAAGLLAPDDGTVNRADAAPQVVFQDAAGSLTPWLTVGEQVSERLRSLRLSAAERQHRVVETMDLVGLDPALMNALPGELSGGQCQRAAVARAIVVPPKLLLCDEPISATDVSLAATMLNLLGDLRRRLRMAMLFVTHDLAAARIIADRIAVLHNGTLVEAGDANTVIAAPRETYTKTLIAAVPRLRAETLR
jgi:peptide/nickel transport system ATP-binding protein